MIRLLPLVALLTLFVACPSSEDPAPEPTEAPTPEGCGDSAVSELEECDDGPDNADDAPDACRTDCRLPRCGDGVVDAGEECDDGGVWGADGCSPACATEDGRLEEERNDTEFASEPLAPQEVVRGALPAEDRDCFAVDVPEGGWFSLDVVGDGAGSCPAGVLVEFIGADYAVRATGAPGLDGCTHIDPVRTPGARFVEPGPNWICLSGFLDREVPVYELSYTVGAETCALEGLPWTDREDPDGDGDPDDCDDDDDGDGVPDVEDNCPDQPNGGGEAVLTTGSEGYITSWLTIGEFHEVPNDGGCRPSTENLIGASDADTVPALGDTAGGETWLAWLQSGNRVDFKDRYGGQTDREVYAVTWLYSPVAQDVTAAIGPDDGAFVWINGELIVDVSGCQGTNVDQFTGEGALVEGWNRILVKVRDHGGGWGMYFRLKDTAGAPLTDYELSLQAEGPWSPSQSDLDGDGVGDVCDDTPAGG